MGNRVILDVIVRVVEFDVGFLQQHWPDDVLALRFDEASLDLTLNWEFIIHDNMSPFPIDEQSHHIESIRVLFKED